MLRPQAVAVAVSLAVALTASGGEANDDTGVQAWLKGNVDDLVTCYRELHQSPELSFDEKETSQRLADELRAAGAKVTQRVGGHGVVGVLENGFGKVLMIRTDMDALPIVERTGLPYASRVRTVDERGAAVGVMHACGHDIHMTNLIGVARFLDAHRNAWRGTVLFVCQPAEERGAGAESMLADGLFVRFPKPDYALALHVSSDTPTGQIGYRAGYSQANVDSVDIVVKGRGGHGAHPDTAIDPVVIAARLITDLQTIVSREVPPIEPAVITVGSIHAGTKHNVISDECRLQLTVRSYSPKVRRQLQEAIRRKALAAAASAGAPEPDVEISEGTPSLYNDPKLTYRVVGAIARALGEENVVEGSPSMGGEDFSRYGEAGVPICMFKLGAIAPDRLDKLTAHGQSPPALHSSRFYPDAEETLHTGVTAMASAALDLLGREKVVEE